MKRLKNLLGGLIAVTLTVFSLQSVAADAQLSGRDFNHMSTGFMLSGGHAIAACETCHIGGVFKGTPRACDGCHANGKRIVATPKSYAHIVTDAQCDTCHFNTATFLGARFNHANALPGQCQTCHNGRLSMSKPTSHNANAGRKFTESCDQCHRSASWLPATWNHDATAAGRCNTCHGVTATGKTASHTTTAKATFQCDSCHNYLGWLPASFKHTTTVGCVSCHNGVTAVGKTNTHTTVSKATLACELCHRSTISWLPASFNHTGQVLCDTCHNSSIAIGAPTSHSSFIGWPMQCSQCHMNTTSFTGALGAKPANHILYNAGVGCTQCHTSGIGNATVTGTTLHAYVSTDCAECHNTGSAYLGKMQKKTTKHIPYNAGTACTTCHTSKTAWTSIMGATLHPYLTSSPCYTCHGKNTLFGGAGQQTASWPNYHESGKNAAAGDCSASGCHKPLGNKGNAYTKWN